MAGEEWEEEFRQGLVRRLRAVGYGCQEFATIAAEPTNPSIDFTISIAAGRSPFDQARRWLADQSDFASAYNAYRQAVAYDQSMKWRRSRCFMLEQQKQQSGGDATSTTRAPKYSAGHTLTTPARRTRRAAAEHKLRDQPAGNQHPGEDLGLNVLFVRPRDAPISFLLRDVTRARALDCCSEQADFRTCRPPDDSRLSRQSTEPAPIRAAAGQDLRQELCREDLEEMARRFKQFSAADSVRSSPSEPERHRSQGTPTELQLVQDMIDMDKNKAESSSTSRFSRSLPGR